VQIVVAHQTTEALKLLTGNIESLRGTLFAFDLWKNTQTSIKVHAMKKEDCPSCSAQATYPALQSHLSSVSTTVLCGRDTIQVRFPTNQSVDLDRIARSLHKATSQVHQTEYLIHCTVDHHRLVIFRDGRMLVHGTNDKEVAKNFYKRFIK
jgi:sulfur carrier protein ThiS adenylyltransferase